MDEINKEVKSKILIIDDEQAIVDMLLEILESNPNLVMDQTTDPLTALEKAKVTKFDLILTDFRMPVLDGGGLVKRIRESDGLSKNTVIMFVTANPEQTQKFVDNYEKIVILEKPISVKKLGEKIIQSIFKHK